MSHARTFLQGRTIRQLRITLGLVLLALLACSSSKVVKDFTGIDVWGDQPDTVEENLPAPYGAPDDSAAAPANPGPLDAGSSSDGPLKPVGFVNYGTVDAVVRPWTWVPLGSQKTSPPSGASTVSTAANSPGLWPNSSRFLSLPMGTYTFCIDWEVGDIDDDGRMDYAHYIYDQPVTLDERTSDDLDMAMEIDIVAPPVQTEILSDNCGINLAASGMAVQFFEGDARQFSSPPDLIALANLEYGTAIEEISIQKHCDDACWLYQYFVGVGAGSWIEARVNVETTEVGVQLWGDENDGWGRILVDDLEVWYGDASGTPPNYFIKYLVISGLPLGTHVIRVENVSGGVVVVAFFGARVGS